MLTVLVILYPCLLDTVALSPQATLLDSLTWTQEQSHNPECSTCPKIQACEMVVCHSHMENGKMIRDHTTGCVLYCEGIGELICTATADGKVTWSPVDPCIVTTTNAPTTTVLRTTTDRITTLQDAASSSGSVSTTADVGTIFQTDTSIPLSGISYNTTDQTSHTPVNQGGTGTLQPWVFILTIISLAACAVGVSLLICCTIVHFIRRRKKHIYFKCKKCRNARYSFDRQNGRVICECFLKGEMSKARNSDLGDYRKVNGSDNHKIPLHTGQKRQGEKGRGRRWKSMRLAKTRKDNLTASDYITPPTPRSVKELNSRRKHSELGAPTSSYSEEAEPNPINITRPLADVVPNRRSPSPLVYHFKDYSSNRPYENEEDNQAFFPQQNHEELPLHNGYCIVGDGSQDPTLVTGEFQQPNRIDMQGNPNVDSTMFGFINYSHPSAFDPADYDSYSESTYQKHPKI